MRKKYNFRECVAVGQARNEQPEPVRTYRLKLSEVLRLSPEDEKKLAAGTHRLDRVIRGRAVLVPIKKKR